MHQSDYSQATRRTCHKGKNLIYKPIRKEEWHLTKLFWTNQIEPQGTVDHMLSQCEKERESRLCGPIRRSQGTAGLIMDEIISESIREMMKS